MKRYIAILVGSLAVAALWTMVAGRPQPVLADPPGSFVKCANGVSVPDTQGCDPLTGQPNQSASSNCGGVNVATKGLNCSGGSVNPIYDLLNALIKWILIILVPLAVLAIIVSGIQYITSQGNPEGIKGAKSRLTNAIVGLVLLLLMGAILRFLGVV